MDSESNKNVTEIPDNIKEYSEINFETGVEFDWCEFEVSFNSKFEARTTEVERSSVGVTEGEGVIIPDVPISPQVDSKYQILEADHPINQLSPTMENTEFKNTLQPSRKRKREDSVTSDHFDTSVNEDTPDSERQRTQSNSVEEIPQIIIKVFPCSVCGKSFSQSNWLKSHVRLSHERKPLSRKSKLKLENRFKCTFCEKSFSRASFRDRHVLTHTTEKPHICHICKKSYAQNENLYVHLKTHMRETPDENESTSTSTHIGYKTEDNLLTYATSLSQNLNLNVELNTDIQETPHEGISAHLEFRTEEKDNLLAYATSISQNVTLNRHSGEKSHKRSKTSKI